MASVAKLPQRHVGKNGPETSAIGFGLMGLSIGYGQPPSDDERLAILDRAWELGCRNWDSADCYADSEDLLGQWFKLHPERRQDIFLATKFGIRFEADPSPRMWEDSSPEHCEKAIESSLKRLGVDYVDLFYVHRIDPKIPIEKTMRVLKSLQEQGKIKHIGLSEASGETIRRAHAIAPLSAVQVEYNPWSLEIEGSASKNVKQVCEELGISIFAYSPLGRGILSGNYRSLDDFEEGDSRRQIERYQGDNFAKNLVIVDKMSEFAKKKNCTASQLVLAWLLLQTGNLFVIPGTKKIKYLEQNIGAAEVQLSKQEEQDLRQLILDNAVEGSRSCFLTSYVDTEKE